MGERVKSWEKRGFRMYASDEHIKECTWVRMTYEADRDIKTLLALLQVEGLGGAGDGSAAERGYFANTRAYWGDLAQLRRDKGSLVAEVAELEQKVKKVEKERDDARAQASKTARERDTARAEVARFEAARDKERKVKAATAQAAWDEEVAAHREKRAALLRAEKVREEVEKAREEDAKADVFHGVAIHRSAADDQLEAELIAQVEAEEREKIRMEAKAQAERSRGTEDGRSEMERWNDARERDRWGNG